MKFMGWIPNVSGNISFSNIKGTKVLNRAKAPKTINHTANENAGWIYSIQKRNLSDAPFPSKNGDFIYLLEGHVKSRWTEDETLEGIVLTFPVSQLDCDSHQLAKTLHSNQASKADAVALINKLKKLDAALNFRFELIKDGIITITVDENDLPTSNNLKNIVVFEAYSFLKDLIHAHKFHRLDDDAIVVTYPVADENDKKWIIQTIRNIHKSIVFSYRNASHHQDIINALGKVCYLNSFQDIVESRYPELIKFFINTDHLKSSLELKLEDQKEKESYRYNSGQILLTIALSLFALIISMSQLLQVPCIDGLNFSPECKHHFHIDDLSINFVRLFLENWPLFVGGLSITIAGLLVYLNLWRIRRWINNKIGHGFVGASIRVFLAFAASDDHAGKLILYLWLISSALMFSFIIYVALGFWHPVIAKF